MSVTRERPILFSGAMVRAILEGRKTVTRRPVKGLQIPKEDVSQGETRHRWSAVGQRDARYGFCVFGETEEACAMELGEFGTYPNGSRGERLWVREAWQLHEKFTDNCVVVYKANERNSWTEFHRRFPVEVARGAQAKPFQTYGFRPSIHMPRWACRLLLEITAVRVERLQDISTEQIIAEGLSTTLREHDAEVDLRKQWRELWESTGGDWESNPWVWVVEFKRIEQ